MMRNSMFAAYPVYKQAMERVTRRVEIIEAEWKRLGATQEGLLERAAKYPNLKMITGPRRELILSTEASRRR